jgi:hypothetical protein
VWSADFEDGGQTLVWATQAVPVPDLFVQKVDGVAWRSKPSWYIVATKDRTVHPELERFVAKRMGATTVETDSSHVPMLSKPYVVSSEGINGKCTTEVLLDSERPSRGGRSLYVLQAPFADGRFISVRLSQPCYSPIA